MLGLEFFQVQLYLRVMSLHDLSILNFLDIFLTLFLAFINQVVDLIDPVATLLNILSKGLVSRCLRGSYFVPDGIQFVFSDWLIFLCLLDLHFELVDLLFHFLGLLDMGLVLLTVQGGSLFVRLYLGLVVLKVALKLGPLVC